MQVVHLTAYGTGLVSSISSYNCGFSCTITVGLDLRNASGFSGPSELTCKKDPGYSTLCGPMVLWLLCGTLHVMDSKVLTNRDRKHVTSQSQTDDAAAAFWKKGCCSMQRVVVLSQNKCSEDCARHQILSPASMRIFILFLLR